MVQHSASLNLPTFKQKQSALSSSKSSLPPTQPATRSISFPTANDTPAEPAALPFLPKAKRLNFSSHRNDANAALAMNLLTDVEKAVSGWHTSLRQILLDIQTLYMAGPIIDGWLEAIPTQDKSESSNQDAGVLRHGDAEQIAAYVEKLAQTSRAAAGETPLNRTSQYRLCSLDTDGQVKCQLCPPEQLGVISQAIARNQKLRQLVSQKQYLEARLKRAAEALETTRKAIL